MPWKLQLKTYKFQAERSPKERHSRLRLKELRKVKMLGGGHSAKAVGTKWSSRCQTAGHIQIDSPNINLENVL